jgi:hypothetical protein
MKWKMNKNLMEKRVLMCQLFLGRDNLGAIVLSKPSQALRLPPISAALPSIDSFAQRLFPNVGRAEGAERAPVVVNQ